MPVDVDVDKVAQYAAASRQSYERDLKTLVDIPGVSMDPERKGDINRTAEAAAKLLRDAGAKVEIIQTKGNPVVFAEMIADPTYPTVMIYNHMDVQPADAAEWKTAPFDMKVEDGTYRGRGTTDDKGPALAVLLAAKYAREHKIAVNIKFIWELEEEIGSPNFEQFLIDNKSKLDTDSIVISDTIWVSRERPAIPYGLRGLQGVLVRLKTGAKDVHSGTTGGLARNPIGELAQLISECYDARTGHVNIPGFYDDVRKPSESETNNFVASGFDVDAFKKAHELKALRTNDPKEASQRIWALPTFEVHGITGGYHGPGVKTIVPHEAEAKISMRLVKDQDPNRVFELFQKFVKEKCPEAEVIAEGALRPYLGEFTGPYNKAASDAMKAGFGKEAAFTREGGSIGAVVSMHDILNKPIVFLGLSLPEHGYHAINENFDWQQAYGGIKMFVQYFNELSKLKP